MTPASTFGVRTATGRISVLGGAVALALALAACGNRPVVTANEPTLVTWVADGDGTAGQIIVRVTNVSDETVDPDLFRRDAQSSATLLDSAGHPLPGASRIQLHAVPQTLEPGESGWLLADFAVPDEVADLEVTLNAGRADARERIGVTDFELIESAEGLGARGTFDWGGDGSAVARAIALDADGRPLGFVATSTVSYDVGDFTMCCFPPDVEPGAIEDVQVYGVQAISEN